MAISSLGLGSGVLTADVIDQLKSNETSVIVNPIDSKIELNKQKTEALDMLESLMSTFKASSSALGGSDLYQSRIATSSGDAASVTSSAGVSVQNFDIEVIALAKKDIIQSSNFASSSALVANADGKMTIDVNGLSYDIDYTASTTLEELSQSINDIAGQNITSKILEVADGDFRLIMSSKNEGVDNDITLSDSGGMLTSPAVQADTSDPLKWGSVQEATNSEFKYDGITLSRSNNKVEDLIVGVTLNLNQLGSSKIDISQNVEEITTEMQTFTDSYNELQDQLSKMTSSDVDEGTIGIFNGDNTIKGIKRVITKVITSYEDNNSLVQFGLELNQTGRLSFNSSDFLTKFNEDPSSAEKYFAGGTTINSDGSDTFENGAFNNLKDVLNNYIGSTGTLTTFSTQLSDNGKTFIEDREKAIKLIDQRFNTMTERFVAYDMLIGKLDAQFSVLQQQIQMSMNGS